MNDFDLNKAVLDLTSNTNETSKLLITVIIISLLNLFGWIGNIFYQFKLKKFDKKIISFQLKESKRVEFQEKLYIELEKLTYIDPNTESENLMYKVKELLRFSESNDLYFDKKIKNLIQKIYDYYLGICVDPRKKNYDFENKQLENYKNLFNK